MIPVGILAAAVRRAIDPGPEPSDPLALSIATKMVSWWDFDGDLQDAIGGNHLTGTASFPAGHINQKAVKSSTLRNTAAIGLPAMTDGVGGLSLGGWVYVDGTGAEDIEARAGSSSSQEAYRLAFRNGNQAHFIAGGSGATTISSSVGAVAVGGWHFVVGTADAGTGDLRLYVDGVLVAQGVAPSSNIRAPSFISFGRQNTNVYNALHNDSSFITDEVLTPEEVAWLYNEGVGRGSVDIPSLAKGAWTWFNDPRAIALPGGQVVVGAATGSGAVLAYSTVDGGQNWSMYPILETTGSGPDDHDNPAFLRRSDGHILVFQTRHNGSEYSLSISDDPDDLSSLTRVGLRSQIGGSRYSYANPFQLTGEAGSPIYNFYREGSSPSWSTYFTKSLDGGITWAPGTRLLDGDAGSGRPYFKAAQNGDDRIDFAVTDGHPDTVTTNGIRHFYYEAGGWFDSSGASIGTPPFHTSADLTTVYDGSAVRAWVWDIQIGADGHPRIVFATFPSTTDHRYHYARWTGDAWVTSEICAAGGPLYAGQPYYSGGVCIDPDDTDTVYASREAAGVWSLYRYSTGDGGASWSEASMGREGIRPYAIKGVGLLAFLEGRYSTYTDFNTRVILTEK